MTTVDPNAVSLTINGKVVSARKGDLIIAAADKSNDFIPRFCYHPRMAPAGMCRQCLVEVEGPRGPMMVVSCMTPVAEGQVVRTETEQVKRLKRVCWSCCSRITHSIVQCATRVASVLCRTKHLATALAKVAM